MQHYFTEMRAAADGPALWKSFTGFLAKRGIRQLYAVQDPPTGSTDARRAIVGAHGLPDSWAGRYVDQGLIDHDPARRMARQHPTPFYWHEIVGRPDLTSGERDFCALFESLGLGGGVFLPVFGPLGRNGYLALFTGTPKSLSEDDLRDFQIVAQMSHQRYCELMDALQPERIGLSPRETEILQWVARGKSNSSIAEILDISTGTVDTHLRRIFDKLDATDRTVASIRGIGLGLIAP